MSYFGLIGNLQTYLNESNDLRALRSISPTMLLTSLGPVAMDALKKLHNSVELSSQAGGCQRVLSCRRSRK